MTGDPTADAARQATRVAALARQLRWAGVPLADVWDGGRWVVAAPGLAWQASVKPGGSTRVTYWAGDVSRRLDLFGDPVDVAGVVASTLSGEAPHPGDLSRVGWVGNP